jgi:hypothetical protein
VSPNADEYVAGERRKNVAQELLIHGYEPNMVGIWLLDGFV